MSLDLDLATDAALAAYEAAADAYDAFTAHHDYELWVGAIERIARPHGLRGTRLLDVGCGTGKSFEPFVARGWEVTACDQSPAMLRHAVARAEPGGVRLVQADARRLDVLGSFDLVVALDDVVNYLAPDELVPAFAGVAANLAPDGLFVFDLNTLCAYRTFFAQPAVVEEPGRTLVWQGRASGEFAPGDVAGATLDVFTEEDDGCWRRVRGEHRQHHHPVPRVRAALGEAGLALDGVYGQDPACNFERGVDEPRHSKSVVIARHGGAPGEQGR